MRCRAQPERRVDRLAPIVVIAATLTWLTLSNEAANQVATLTGRRRAMVAGTRSARSRSCCSPPASSGSRSRSPDMHRDSHSQGGVLCVLGSLGVVFVNGVGAAAPAIVHGLNLAQHGSRDLHFDDRTSSGGDSDLLGRETRRVATTRLERR